MQFDNQHEDESRDDKSPVDDLPPIEDANISEESSNGVVTQDDRQILDAAAMTPAGGNESNNEGDAEASDLSRDNPEDALPDVDDTSDAGTVQTEPGDHAGADESNENPDWEANCPPTISLSSSSE